MNEGLNALVLFIGLVLLLMGCIIVDESLPPTEQKYKAKEREYLKWLIK